MNFGRKRSARKSDGSHFLSAFFFYTVLHNVADVNAWEDVWWQSVTSRSEAFGLAFSGTIYMAAGWAGRAWLRGAGHEVVLVVQVLMEADFL
jgi:hypothetical protein